MPKQACISLRPGSILRYKGRRWRVIANDTLIQRFTISAIGAPAATKSFTYRGGQEVDIVWKPEERI